MIDGSKNAVVSWLLNFRIRMFVKSAVNFDGEFAEPIIKFVLVSDIQISGLTWGIVSLSPMIWIRQLRSSAHSDQTRTAHDVIIYVFCGIRDAFLCSSSSP